MHGGTVSASARSAWNPSLTVVVPSYNSASMLRRCLMGLVESDLPRGRWELIVVDDGSDDDTAHIAKAFADEVIRLADGPRGPAHARNVGAERARSDVLLFIDADVVVAPTTLRTFVERFARDPTLGALFGSYDDQPADPGLVSQYRNLLHRFVHLQHAGEADTFWTGCGAVRLAPFRAVGGFDAERYPRPQVEDIELGYRLRDRDVRIELAPDIACTHLKRWTVRGMLRTDLCDRAMPWTRLLLERRAGPGHGPLNIAPREKLLTAIAGVGMASLATGVVLQRLVGAWLAFACAVLVLFGNRELLTFLAERRGWVFSLRCVPLRLAFYGCSVLGALWALVGMLAGGHALGDTRPGGQRRRASAAPRWAGGRGHGAVVVAVLALLALHAALAWAMRVPGLTLGGDDAAYLALARALRALSYTELWTQGTPVHAMYPPGYPALLAALGAVGPEGVERAVAANIALSVLALGGAALLAARITPWLAVPLLLVCAPNPMLVGIAGRVFSEPLFTALVVGALVLLTASTRRPYAPVVAGALVLAGALTRSIGVALLLAVLIEWGLARRWRSVAVLSACAGLLVGSWFLWTARAPRLSAGSSYVADAMYDASAPRVAIGQGAAKPSAASRFPLAPVLAKRIVTNVPNYLARTIPAALQQPTRAGTLVDNVLGLALLLIAGACGVVSLARRQRLLLLSLATYFGVLLCWPYNTTRFVAPVLPLVVLVALAGLRWLGARLGSSRVAWGVIWAVSGVLALSAMQSHRHRLAALSSCERRGDAIITPGCATAVQRDYFAAIAAADSLAPDSSPILTAKEATAFVRSGRRTVRQSEALERTDPDAFVRFLRARGVQVIVLSRVHYAQWGLAPMLQARCHEFDALATYGAHTALLRLPPEQARRPTSNRLGDACGTVRAWATGDWDAEVNRTRFTLW